MSKLTKLAFLYLVLLLSVAGTGKDPYADLLQTTIRDFEEVSSFSYFTESKPNVYGLHNTFENVVSQSNSFPSPHGKNHPASFWARSFSIESGLQSFALQYLSYTRTIQLSLSIGDIIFPFHYFW